MVKMTMIDINGQPKKLAAYGIHGVFMAKAPIIAPITASLAPFSRKALYSGKRIQRGPTITVPKRAPNNTPFMPVSLPMIRWTVFGDKNTDKNAENNTTHKNTGSIFRNKIAPSLKAQEVFDGKKKKSKI